MVHVKFPPIPPDAAKDFDGRIVIIGAGVAGLFAANTLKYLGVKDYVILEASERIGGRLKSCNDLHHEFPLDLGAEWIHDKNERMVKDMLVFKPDKDSDDDNSKDLLPEDFIKYQPEFTLRSGRKSKLVQCLYQETKWKRSTWWHWLRDHVYSHVQEKIKLNSIVTGIIYTGISDVTAASEASAVKVRVQMADGTEYEADKVICTVPLAVLKKGDTMLKFTPPLPDPKRLAINGIDMPPGFRILFEMKTKFYPDLKLGCGLVKMFLDEGEDLTIVYDALYGKELSTVTRSLPNSPEQNILAFVAIGNKNAGAMGHLDEENIVKSALKKIDELFDGEGSRQYVRHVVQNWTLEPYVLGSYSFPGPIQYRRELGKTVGRQVLFAGEHTSLKYFSLVP
eukprot:CAMPEP_0194277274 /NCGR_PEP_ID=MMETSP0169-20130528/9636_1 /TAXON_ID=218684 /ORGANISM="Corethron pennatum, Strain L29A3" /LENGTH=394 /DNA_ID=CAMNT_0039021201 /DNA_START=31 /DNA_END=1211 /DNA_ORIENTATION=+